MGSRSDWFVLVKSEEGDSILTFCESAERALNFFPLSSRMVKWLTKIEVSHQESQHYLHVSTLPADEQEQLLIQLSP
jgi:hypothetical protein